MPNMEENRHWKCQSCTLSNEDQTLLEFRLDFPDFMLTSVNLWGSSCALRGFFARLVRDKWRKIIWGKEEEVLRGEKRAAAELGSRGLLQGHVMSVGCDIITVDVTRGAPWCARFKGMPSGQCSRAEIGRPPRPRLLTAQSTHSLARKQAGLLNRRQQVQFLAEIKQWSKWVFEIGSMMRPLGTTHSLLK